MLSVFYRNQLPLTVILISDDVPALLPQFIVVPSGAVVVANLDTDGELVIPVA